MDELQIDDFKEQIVHSSDDEDYYEQNRKSNKSKDNNLIEIDEKGRLTDEMVINMNFGGGLSSYYNKRQQEANNIDN